MITERPSEELARLLAYRLGTLPHFYRIAACRLSKAASSVESAADPSRFCQFRGDLHSFYDECGELLTRSRQAIEKLSPLIQDCRKAQLQEKAYEAVARELDHLREYEATLHRCDLVSREEPASDVPSEMSIVLSHEAIMQAKLARDLGPARPDGGYQGDQELWPAIREFWAALPSPCLGFARLGDVIGVAMDPRGFCHSIPTFGDGEVGLRSIDSYLKVALLDIHELGLIPDEWFCFFGDIERHPSVPFERHRSRYFRQVSNSASVIHERILAKLSSFSAASEELQRWISASQAVEIANVLGADLSLSWLSRIAKKSPRPFEWRKPSENLLQIEVVSFLEFLTARLKRRRRKDPELSEEEVERNKATVLREKLARLR